MASLRRRRPEPAAVVEAPAAPAEPLDPRRTPKKDHPTPKRSEAARTVRPRGPVEPPPLTSKEAKARGTDYKTVLRPASPSSRGGTGRGKGASGKGDAASGGDDGRSRREVAREQREGMRAGDEAFMQPRDRGPVRAHVRDLVDSRRGPLSLFLPFFLLYTLQLLLPQPVQGYVLVVLVAFLVLMALEAVRLGQRITAGAGERFPRSDERPRSLVIYGLLRATLFRRLRNPRPRVAVNQEV